MTPSVERELRKLRERIEELEAEVERLKDVLAPVSPLCKAFGLSEMESRTVLAIAKRGRPSTSQIADTIYAQTDDPPEYARITVAQFVNRARAKLKPHGIEIHSKQHNGFWLEPDALARLRELGAL